MRRKASFEWVMEMGFFGLMQVLGWDDVTGWFEVCGLIELE
jgi:hypothetical protein